MLQATLLACVREPFDHSSAFLHVAAPCCADIYYYVPDDPGNGFYFCYSPPQRCSLCDSDLTEDVHMHARDQDNTDKSFPFVAAAKCQKDSLKID